MDVSSYLEQVHALDERVTVLQDSIEEIWTALTRITIDPSKEYVAGGSSDGKMENLISTLTEHQMQLFHLRFEALTKRAIIAEQISSLSNSRCIEFLKLKYLERDEQTKKPLRYGQIAERMHYSESHIYNVIRPEALKAFQDKYSSITELH